MEDGKNKIRRRRKEWMEKETRETKQKTRRGQETGPK